VLVNLTDSEFEPIALALRKIANAVSNAVAKMRVPNMRAVIERHYGMRSKEIDCINSF